MTTPLAAIDADLDLNRYSYKADQILVIPQGGATTDDATRLFGTSGLGADAAASGKPLVFLAGTYYVLTDATVPTGAVLVMRPGATFSVASGKTLDASLAIVKADSTWYAGSGSTTVPTTSDVLPGPVTVTGAIRPVGGIALANKTANSGTGDATTITGQNETGTTSVGGAVNISGGTGTSTSGAVNCTGGAVVSGTGGAMTCTGGAATAGTGGAITCTGGAGTTAGGAAGLIGGLGTTVGGAIAVGGGAGTTTGGAVNIYTGDGVTKGALTVKTGGAAGTVRFSANGTGIGFYATAPVALQTGVAVSAAGVHAALVNLGLITA